MSQTTETSETDSSQVVFGTYAASEIERLRRSQERLGEVGDVDAAQFLAAEFQFLELRAAHPSLKKISSACEDLGKKHGFPPSDCWPRQTDLGKFSSQDSLSSLGHELVELWGATYQIETGALIHRIEIAAVASLMSALLPMGNRKARDEAKGAAILKAIEQLYVTEWQRMKIDPYLASLSPEDFRVTAEIVGRSLLGEGATERGARRTGVFGFAGMELSKVAGLVCTAPLALWRSSHQRARAERAAEDGWKKRLPALEFEFTGWPTSVSAGVSKGPASIALESLGLVSPNEEWSVVVAATIEKLPHERAPALVEWACARFAFLLMRLVAQESVWRGIVQTVPSPYAGSLAQCLVAAYVRDAARVDRFTANGKKPATGTRGAIYWSAISRGWGVAWDLIPSYCHCPVYAATGYNLG